MKRNIYKLLIAALVVSTATVACKDERNNFMVDDAISFAPREVYETTSLINEMYDLAIIKSGKGMSKATVQLAASEPVLEEYNAENGTNYVLLPTNYYNMPTEVSFSEKDTRKFVKITWVASELASLDETVNYVIPIELSVKNDALQVAEERGTAIIHPVMSKVTMEEAEVINPKATGETVSRDFSILIDNPVKLMDITVNYEVDLSLVAGYNTANGTNYKPAPDYISITDESSVIPKGANSTTFTCEVESEGFFTNNILKSADDYLLPVRITSISNEVIGTIKDVIYIPISVNRTMMGPWTILEGQNLCYANQEGNPAPGWAGAYVTQRLFDGNVGSEWISWWDGGVNIPFPMEFVVDFEQTQVFTKLYVDRVKHPHHWNYREFEFYIAQEYDGANTVWTNITGGRTPEKESLNEFTVNTMLRGRYLKFVIVSPELTTDDCILGRGKLNEVYGIGF